MKNYDYTCPVCGKKHKARQTAIDCAELDVKESMSRRLIPLKHKNRKI